MISGRVNECLLPIIRTNVKKLDGDWQEFNILLDTGSEVRCMLSEAAVSQYGIRQDSSYQIEMQLETDSILIEFQFLRTNDFSGLIGPSLLPNRRLTIDVVENGAVEIGSIPAPILPPCIRSLIGRPKRPSDEYTWKLLPWINVEIKDSEGKRQTLSVNVDTGDSGELSLPPQRS